MVTIFYIAPHDESIHIGPAIGKVQSRQGIATMDTIETIRYVGPARTGSQNRRGFVGRLVLVLHSLAKQIDHMLERRRGRLALMEMTDEQLKDIGISRCDAHREGIRSIWD
jgi:uncharacterized protein YjiS (DUF1127 family)